MRSKISSQLIFASKLCVIRSYFDPAYCGFYMASCRVLLSWCLIEEDTGVSMLARGRFFLVTFFLLLISWRAHLGRVQEQSEIGRGQ